jgi:hypothetical protein
MHNKAPQAGKVARIGVLWPAVLDGEAVAGDGHESIQSVFTEWNRIGGDLAFLALTCWRSTAEA